MAPSNGMCIGVTPSGEAGNTRPSISSATRCAIMFAARVSVPVGRCGPCRSTLPAGRMTSGFFLNCAAISGCVNSEKNSARQHFGVLSATRRRAVSMTSARRMLRRFPRSSAMRRRPRQARHCHCRAQLVTLAAATTRGEQVELGPEHVALRHFQLFPLGIAVLAALDIERRALVQLLRRCPRCRNRSRSASGPWTEDPHREDAGRGRAGPT